MKRSVRGILLALLAAVLYALGIPAGKAQTRDGCTCLLGGDIGMYKLRPGDRGAEYETP